MSVKDAQNLIEKSKKNSSDVLVWDKKVPNTEMEKFKKIIESKYNLHFNTYWEFHRWTVDNFPSFWEEVWIHFGVISSKPYSEVFVKTGSGFLDNKWFVGTKLNCAENILRTRDNREALLCLDDEGEFDRVTFAEMFQEVKLYAAAFKKRGLQKGDRVACYMSNRKEAIFAMLAAASIGAIWGGPLPYLGATAAAEIIHQLDAKFLITVDVVQVYNTGEYSNLVDNIPIIAENAPALECIIIVPTKTDILRRDISLIPKSCLLGDFLATGRTPDGDVPDIVFEQLPFDHPLFISFTSGTTGLPKGIVHSIGTLLGTATDFGLHCNLKSGDTMHSYYPMGWIYWNFTALTLFMGVRLFLDNGDRSGKGKNLFDLLAEQKVSLVALGPPALDNMEKMNIQPKHCTNFENLKFIMLGGSAAKAQNYNYLKSIVGENVFIGNIYGSTETFGPISGSDFNSPCYARESQVKSLGRDFHFYNKDGRSVIGENGELIISMPFPNLMMGIWKDVNNDIAHRTYFSKYPGVFLQHDEGYVNPRTKGFVILGRSDDTIIQNGDRIGPADIYIAIHDIEEIEDYICVGQTKSNGDSRAVLFIKLKAGHSLTPEFREKVAKKIESHLYIDCVPEVILQVNGIPYNANNKRVESLVRKIIASNQIPKMYNIKNPKCLMDYCNIPELMNYNKV